MIAGDTGGEAGDARGLRGLSRREKTLLAAIVVVGLLLRIAYQSGRPFLGDEVGTIESLDRSYGFLLTNFELTNREQLTMNYHCVLLKALRGVLGGSPWVLAAPSLLAGAGAILAVAALAVRLATHRTALVAAALVALNPCLVEFSARIRSYMLLVAFALAAIVAFYDWSRRRTSREGWHAGIACAIWSTLALLAHPNAAYQMGFLGVLFLAHLAKRRKDLHTFVIPMGAAAVVVVLAYASLWSDMQTFRANWVDTPPTAWDYLPHTARLLIAGGWAMWPTLILFGAGLWMAAGEARTQDLEARDLALGSLGLGIVVPMALASAQGVSHFPWTYARFLLPVLPLLLIFVARAITGVAPRSVLAAVLLTGVVVGSWSWRMRSSFAEKAQQPYAEAAAHLVSQGVRDDEVLCIDSSTRSHLSLHLPREVFLPKRWMQRLPENGGRLFLIGEETRMRTKAPAAVFGNIQIVTYRAASRRRLLEKLADDLEDTLRDRVSSRLVDKYELLLEILPAVGREDQVLKKTKLWYECLMRSRRQLYAPPQLMENLTKDRFRQ